MYLDSLTNEQAEEIVQAMSSDQMWMQASLPTIQNINFVFKLFSMTTIPLNEQEYSVQNQKGSQMTTGTEGYLDLKWELLSILRCTFQKLFQYLKWLLGVSSWLDKYLSI